MAGWDGAGNFVLNYSFVAEAAGGIKILASHQDQQWATFQVGIMNCLTRDGQNSPSADIPWNSKKITGLATPTASTDAATKGYVDSAFGEWTPETFTFSWVSATTFKVSATDATARYHAGRRLKIVHNTGGTTTYGTVISSVFGVDTTVTVAMDAAVALVSTITALSYGVLSYTNPSYLDPRAAVSVYMSASQAIAAVTPTQLLYNTEDFDLTSEFDAVTNKRFVATRAGIYLVTQNLQFQQTAATSTFVNNFLYINGVQSYGTQQSATAAGAANITPSCFTKALRLAKGDTVAGGCTTGLAGTLLSSNAGCTLEIVRIA